MTPAERIVIFRLGSLGDTVVALPCFHLIQRAFPDAERIVLTNVPVSSKAAPLEAILREGGLIHRAITYPGGVRDPRTLVRLARELRTQRATTLVYLAPSRGLRAAWRDVGYFRSSGFKRIIGAPLTRDLLRNRVDGHGMVERESERLARTLAELGQIDLSDRTWWDLLLTDRERSDGTAALAALGGRPFVAINTGGKAVENDWGEHNWAAVLRGLSAELRDHAIVFVGASEDSERAERLGQEWTGGPVFDLCGRIAPRVSAAALTPASVFIGHDSGPLHLADAVGTPAVGLFGDYNRPRKWHPSGETTEILHRMEGLLTIYADEVIRTALRLAR